MSRSIYNTSYVQLNVLCSTFSLVASRKHVSIIVQLLALGNKKLEVHVVLMQFKDTPIICIHKDDRAEKESIDE